MLHSIDQPKSTPTCLPLRPFNPLRFSLPLIPLFIGIRQSFSTAFQRFFQPLCFSLGVLQEDKLVFLRFERFLDKLVLDVLLVAEGETGSDEGRELGIDVKWFGGTSLP